MSQSLQTRAFILPSLITVIGLFSGFLSIISSIKGNYEMSVKYIALAFVFDGLDGRVARKLNAASPFGREFDSLCDLVAFGVAPAILIWEWMFRATFDEFGVLVAFLFIAAGATRLARFNIATTSEPKSYFQGLPVPAAAAGLASLVYSFPLIDHSMFISVLVLVYMVFLSGLMVSTFRFTSFKRLSIKDVDHRKVLLGLSLLVACIWKFDRVAVFLVLFIYILSAPYMYFFKKKEVALDSESSTENSEAGEKT
jgi:CDP-diacylglycerol--serine O-phosphatidyltransferase